MADVMILAPFILSFEGGFVNDPDDMGGATNKGVTLATWRKVGYDKDGDGDIDVKDLKLISDEEAVNAVLKPHYWDRWKANEIESQSLANILVDWVWGSGKHGIVIPQRMLGVTADGIVGPKTLAALNATNHKEFFDMVKAERELFFHRIVAVRPSQKKFLKGWLRRLNDIEWGRLTTNGGKEIKFKDR
jgi:lysozyme family protein